MLLFWIKSQPGVVYKTFVYTNACNVVLQSSKNEEITLPQSLFLCLSGILLRRYCGKSLTKSEGEGIKWGNGHREGLSLEEGAQTFCTPWSCLEYYKITLHAAF